MNPAYRIESMQLEDLPAVCALERAAGMSTLGEAFFRQKLNDTAAMMLVARAPQVVALFSSWVIVDELEIDNLVVAASHQRQGIGAALLAEALRRAAARGVQSAVLEVRASNVAARRLYESFGFVACGRRRDYYRDPQEDALNMRAERQAVWERLEKPLAVGDGGLPQTSPSNTANTVSGSSAAK